MIKNKSYYYKNLNCSYKKILLFLNSIKCLNIKNFFLYIKFLNNKHSRILFNLIKISLKNFFILFNNKKILFYKILILKGKIKKKIIYKAKGNYSLLKNNYCNINIFFYYG